MGRRLLLGIGAIAGALVWLACGDDPAPEGPKPLDASPDITIPNDAGEDAPPEAGRLRLAASGAQFVVKGGPVGIELRPANLAEDTDVISVHQDFYGIPWDAFEVGTAPPTPWVEVIDRLIDDVKTAQKGVFLSLTPLNGGRNTLSKRIAADGSGAEGWAAPCYDFRTAPDAAATRAAYIRYVEYMVDRFAPDYLAIGIEVNLFQEQCPAAWEGMVDLLDAAYDAAKAKRPSVIAFPTIEVGHLQGYAKAFCDPANKDACLDANLAKMARLHRDRFAMSTYPYLQDMTDVATVPGDWFSRAPSRAGERAIIAETGWLSTPLVVEGNPGQCATAITFSNESARAWLDRVLAARAAQNMDLVTWISDRDVLDGRLMTDCPCTFDADWCALRGYYRDAGGPDASPIDGELALKAFGAMGLRAYDGTPKSLVYDRWHQALIAP